MTKAIAQTYHVTTPYRAYVTAFLCAGCLMASLVYAVSLYRVVSHTVALEHLNSQTAQLSGAVDALDSQYLALSSAATVDSLSSYGLQAGDVTAYIPRSISAASLGTLAVGGHEF